MYAGPVSFIYTDILSSGNLRKNAHKTVTTTLVDRGTTVVAWMLAVKGLCITKNFTATKGNVAHHHPSESDRTANKILFVVTKPSI